MTHQGCVREKTVSSRHVVMIVINRIFTIKWNHYYWYLILHTLHHSKSSVVYFLLVTNKCFKRFFCPKQFLTHFTLFIRPFSDREHQTFIIQIAVYEMITSDIRPSFHLKDVLSCLCSFWVFFIRINHWKKIALRRRYSLKSKMCWKKI